ncbi:GTP-binding protein [bacterium]|nr:GTP-binding protein [bacterium]
MKGLDDTIAALASAPGAAARGIIRISGPGTFAVLKDWFVPADAANWQAAKTPQRHSGKLLIPQARAPFESDVQWWPGRRSYTGQPLAELHMVGSPPVLSAVLAELYRRGARPAEPGEFTLRAFLAGKLDLLQAEAVLGVIDATGEQELKTALEQLAGGISQSMVLMRRDLLELLADLEAGLDFVEEHLEFVSRDEITRRLMKGRDMVTQLAQQARQRMHAGERPRVVLAGLPNAGKSTLFNHLLGQEHALVSPIPGTTRDYLTGIWHCEGLAVDLIDTAGWEFAGDEIGTAMQQFRHDQLERADLIVWCSAADRSATEREIDARYRADIEQAGRPVFQVITKSDLQIGIGATASSSISVAKNLGLTKLARAVHACLNDPAARDRSWLGSSAARCEQSLVGAAEALSHAVQLAEQPGSGEELIAGELRLALEHLGEIVGVVYTDDLLDRIFSKFCIGK